LHSSISFFLALTLFKLTFTGGMLMLLFAFLISLSRLILKRHILAEVLAGVLTGVVFGLGNYLL
jgi:membrane-associated phospholipid phosphatase